MTYAERTILRDRPGPALRLPDALSIISSDIPEGMTIDQYRRNRPKAPSRISRLLRR
jgi:hypothetical protein